MSKNNKKFKSYKEIPVTHSKKELIATLEYQEYVKELSAQLGNGLSGKEFMSLLDIYLKKLLRYMDNKRKTVKREIKTIIKNYSTNTILFKTKRLLGREDIENHVELLHNDILIEIPSEEDIIKNYKIMLDRCDIDYSNKNSYAFISVNILGIAAFNSYSPKIRLDDENMYKNLIKEIMIMLDRYPLYEPESSKPIVEETVMTFTVTEIRSVDNWYATEVEEIVKYDDFEMFVANNKLVDCKQQCVEFLGGKWDDNKTIAEMIPQKEIINYLPIHNMKNVEKLSDFVTDKDSLTNDCKNVARIVQTEGHMGVISKIITKRIPTNKQTKRIIVQEQISDNQKEIFVDIESFTHDKGDKNKSQIPYLICWTSSELVEKAYGRSCIEEFFDSILSSAEIDQELILYAWYGSGYDYQHLLPYIKNLGPKEKIIIKNNAIIYAEFYFELIRVKIVLKDPFLFMLTSLDKAAKAFKVLNKSSFPHSIIKNWSDLDIILENWIKIQHKIIENKTDNKVGLVVRKEEILEYEQTKNYKTILQKAIEYCELDVLAMKQVWEKFRFLIKENLNISITKNIFTLSQLSMNLMQSLFTKNVELYVPSTDEYSFLSKAVYGGRVIAKNGVYKENIIYADVVSLYPSAMKLLMHCYGKPKRVNKINWNLHGIYKVKLTHNEDLMPKDYLSFVPRRDENGRLKWGWFKEHEGVYHTYDLLIAKDQNFNIECIEGVEYPYKDYIFNAFIDKLYKLKDDHLSCKCEEKPCPIRMIAKIALNGGGYGKFVQKPIEKEVYVVRRDVVAGRFLEVYEDGLWHNNHKINMPEFFNLDGEIYDKMVIETIDKPVYATQNGISILSGSRYRLYCLCKKFSGLDIVYSDTDSVFIRESSINYENFKKSCNTELGALDDTIEGSFDNKISEMVICGPKMYGYSYKDDENNIKQKVYCKGVPNYMLTIDHLKMIVMEEKDAKYIYTMLKKGLITIKEREIEKVVKET